MWLPPGRLPLCTLHPARGGLQIAHPHDMLAQALERGDRARVRARARARVRVRVRVCHTLTLAPALALALALALTWLVAMAICCEDAPCAPRSVVRARVRVSVRDRSKRVRVRG